MQTRIWRACKDFLPGAVTFRGGLVLLLTTALLATESGVAFAQGPQAPDPAAVQSQVKKFGVGKSVKMKLVNGEQVSGHISAIGADSFTVRINKSSTERTIPYAQVTEIKDPGPIGWILIGAAIVIVIILIAHH
jgi:hypothetical protein